MSETNETTKKILNHFFKIGVFAYRQNTTGIPLKTGGFRPTSKKGVPDIIAILPPHGIFCGLEIKTGNDRLSPEQEGFRTNCTAAGGIYLEIKSFEDFLTQWESYLHNGQA